MRYAFEIEGKTYFAVVSFNRCAPCEVVVFTETQRIKTGMKWIFESLQECVERIVATSKRS